MTRFPGRSRYASFILGVTAAGALAAAPGAEARVLIVKSSGRTVKARVGDRIKIDVTENPSTGYAWRTTSKPAFLRLSSSTYTADPHPPGLVGGGGRRVFIYRVLRRGSGRLKMVYQQPFAPNPADKKFVVKIAVKG